MGYLRLIWFPVLSLLIIGISLYDTFLLVRFQDCIEQTEKNPFGVWLIEAGNGDVEVFVRAKLAGTFVVILTLFQMYRTNSRKTLPVISSIAVYQLWLLAYLTF